MNMTMRRQLAELLAVDETAPLAPRVLVFIAARDLLDVDGVDALARTSPSLQQQIAALKLRRRTVRRQGFPPARRITHWLQSVDVATLVEDARGARVSSAQSPSPSRLLELLGLGSFGDAVALDTTGLDGEISRDVDRTFPMLPFFASHGDGQRQLANVLKAVACQEPDVAYCQGMNYVAAALLLLSTTTAPPAQWNPQEAAFWLLVALIRRRGMHDVWKAKMPGLSWCIYLYQQLLRRYFYDLHSHLRNIGMHPSLIATQWFATLFARVLSMDSLVRVWDLVLLDGWKMVFRVALAITAFLRPKILHLGMEECSEYFRSNPKLELEQLRPDDLIASAFSFKVTRTMLVQIDEERTLEYLRLRLQAAPISVEHSLLFPMLDEDGSFKKKETLEYIRTQLQQFDSDTAGDMSVLRKKIETIDRTVATATSKLNQHSYALNELNQHSYALNEVSFALQEQLTMRRKLRARFDATISHAISRASSPSSARSGQRESGRQSFFKTWLPSPASTLNYVQSSMAVCFERAARLPVLSRANGDGEMEEEQDDVLTDEQARNLRHLEILVPSLAAELNALIRRLAESQRELRVVQQRFDRAARRCQVAQVELEEAQTFKDRLADQMLQIILETERQKNHKMQQLFAQVDGDVASTPQASARQSPHLSGSRPQTARRARLIVRFACSSMGLFKLLASTALAAAALASMATVRVDAHAFLLLPKAEFTTDKKNFYAFVVDGDKVPPFSSYTTGDAEKNSQGFKANYKRLNPPSLKQFILQHQVRATGSDIPAGGTAECGFSKPNIAPLPVPDHLEFGNYNLNNPSGLHPGPCEAWCDNDIVVPFTEDCRTLFQKPIPYDKAKCLGKSRLTFYWLATHFAPFQVYIGCAPLQGGRPSGGNGTTPATPTPTSRPQPNPNPNPNPPQPTSQPKPQPRPGRNPSPRPRPIASDATPAPAPAPSKNKCNRRRD
ncbi:hypothetical protein P43SY_005773 [Pythium insidiosum]|uniref:Rab-GAP TBC domain-containing protein n=1 Tax=Pythium insidiosum TaxID=114742 RepID=A0AAD5MBQ1_PYTIN|nr:hypothetical protein P43SY_005773 [Pythium insidiosum]